MTKEVKRGDGDVDEQFRALMEGLRTTLPGVQVLFAFLLTLPLQSAFSDLRGIERHAYYVAFIGAALASVLLIAPSAHQRMRAPITGIKRRHAAHLRTAANLAIAGTVIFAVALAASVFLISTLVFEDAFAGVAAGVVALLTVWAWFYLPLVRFNRD